MFRIFSVHRFTDAVLHPLFLLSRPQPPGILPREGCGHDDQYCGQSHNPRPSFIWTGSDVCVRGRRFVSVDIDLRGAKLVTLPLARLWSAIAQYCSAMAWARMSLHGSHGPLHGEMS